MVTDLSVPQIAQVASQYGLEPVLIEAVIEVETTGSGFLPDGRPKILFEGHIFYRELKKANFDVESLMQIYPNIIYPKWDKSKYKGGTKEYDRLNLAKVTDAAIALSSASWGIFQIMGLNFKAAGFSSVQSFVSSMSDPVIQLDAFFHFCGSTGLLQKLKDKDWVGFAKGYNGPGYAQNSYDSRLAYAYSKHLSRR